MTIPEEMLALIRRGFSPSEVVREMRARQVSFRGGYSSSDVKHCVRAYCERRGLEVPASCMRLRDAYKALERGEK